MATKKERILTTLQKKSIAISLYANQHTMQEIGDTLGVNVSTISRWIKSEPEFCKLAQEKKQEMQMVSMKSVLDNDLPVLMGIGIDLMQDKEVIANAKKGGWSQFTAFIGMSLDKYFKQQQILLDKKKLVQDKEIAMSSIDALANKYSEHSETEIDDELKPS